MSTSSALRPVLVLTTLLLCGCSSANDTVLPHLTSPSPFSPTSVPASAPLTDAASASPSTSPSASAKASASASPRVSPSAAPRTSASPSFSPSTRASASLQPTAAKTTPSPSSPRQPPLVVQNRRCAPAPTSSLVVNVHDTGAHGNGSGDDSGAIQKALDQVAGTGGTVLIPAGTYPIQAERGLKPGSQTTLQLEPGAVLRAITTSADIYNLIRVEGRTAVSIVGGTVEGDLGRHQGSSGQWGHGINVLASSDIVIDSVTATQAWGDGFYIGSKSARITMCSVTADHNRRQGISVTSVDDLIIRDSTFTRTVSEPGGAGSGIDLEPNGNEHLRNVQIIGSHITANALQGISMGMAEEYQGTSTISNITISGCTIEGNGLNATAKKPYFGVWVSSAKDVKLVNNAISANRGGGVNVIQTDATTLRGNRITDNLKFGPYEDGGAGVIVDRATGTVVAKDNTLTGNAGPPVSVWSSTVSS